MNSQLLKRYERDLALKGFSQKTQQAYYRNLVQFLQYNKNMVDSIDAEAIKDYLYHLIVKKKLSQSSLRQARCSISYFFSQTLGKAIEVVNIPC